MNPRKSQLKSGIILNYVNTILGNLIPLFYTPVMLSLLGQSEYGLYKLSSSVTSYLSLISLGLGSAITRYLIKSREEEGKEAEERILGLFVRIFRVIAAVTLIVGMVLVFNLYRWYGESLTGSELSRMKILVFLMVCNTALSFSLSPYISVVNAHEEFLFLQGMSIVTTCVGPILNLIVLYLGYASVGMAVSSLILGIVSRTIYYLYVSRTLGIKARYEHVPSALLREIMSFSFWVFVSNVVGQLYAATDTVLIGSIPSLATTGVAIYSIGIVVNSMIGSFTNGISSLLTPMANRMVFAGANSLELTGACIKVGRIQGYISGLVISGFIAFGKPFIYFYAGEGYMDAYWVAVVTTLPCIVFIMQSLCLSIIVAQNKHKFRSLVYLAIAIANLIGTWIVLPYWGIVGAAAVTGIATFAGQGLIMNWYYEKNTGLDVRMFWFEAGKVLIIPTGLCIITVFLNSIINFYDLRNMLIGIIVYTIGYIVLTWGFVMNSYEKGLICDVVKIFLWRKEKE